MITQTPYRLHNYVRPGGLAEERFAPEPTRQMDSDEAVRTCLSCTLARCQPDADCCPLNELKTAAVTKAGKPDMRRRENRPKPTPNELDLKVLKMIRDGWRQVWISCELGVEAWQVRESIKKLERLELL